MRAELADTALTRYAGRFVWLELNFDSPANRDFLTRRSIVATPTLLVLDPADERATATHLGGLARPEFVRFLDQGARGVQGRAASPADSALARGEAHLGLGQLDAAIASYRDALRLATPSWPHRERAVMQLTRALQAHGDAQAGATLAAAEAPRMARSPVLAQVVDPGLACAIRGRDAPWASQARKTLVPLAAAALDIPGVDPDTRNQLYMSLVADAQVRGDSTAASHWGTRYQHDLEGFVPRNDDERTALDIACVEAADYVPHPERVVP